MASRAAGLPHWPGTNVDNYARALEAAGLQALELRLEQGPGLAACAGLVLPGGVDVDPALYGAAPDPRTQQPARQRDAFELSVLEAALARDLPVLAICRGHQLLNVAFGGRLLQHIESGEHEAAGPSSKSPSRCHSVALSAGKLGDVLGAESIAVNSRHHQAVTADTVASGLKPTARSPDAFIEGLESEAHRWVVGVQWHPERPEPEIEGFTDASRRLFAAFAKAVAG